MLVRTPSDLGAIIRERRLSDALLAKKAGTSRKWLIEVEKKRKPRREFGLILTTLKALGIELAANPVPVVAPRRLIRQEDCRRANRYRLHSRLPEETEMTEQLVALANGQEMGSVFHRNARLSFIYSGMDSERG